MIRAGSIALAVVLAWDALLGGGAILGALVRLPGGVELPRLDGLLLALALAFAHCAPARAVLAAHAVLATASAGEVWSLHLRGEVRTAFPPLSLLAAAAFGLAAAARRSEVRPARVWAAAMGAPALLLGAHLWSFGATDYRRPAEAIVVFGAKPGSLALHDRVREGVRLYHEGRAPVLVMSGAPDEVKDMARLARLDGVPESAIARDPEGLNTAATLRNLRHRRVIAVSHDYHLARIKLAASRRGLECYTVPCAESRPLARKPYYVAREGAAFVFYYLRGRG